MAQSEQITRWLGEAERGDREAYDKLVARVYDELRGLAGRYLSRERPDHTLQPTALVHEAFLRLVDQTRASIDNQSQFFRVAAQMMRRILVDHARKHGAAKRGGDARRVPLTAVIDLGLEPAADLVTLDESLEKLAAFDPLKGQIVELRFFGGLTTEKTAGVLGISRRTVEREWSMARTWLFKEIREGG